MELKTKSSGGKGGVPIAPGLSVFAMFPSFNYHSWAALAEIVDNSVTSYILNKKKLLELEGPAYRLRIEINYDEYSGIITIKDNAAGISASDYDRAFKLASPPPDLSSIGQYGIGLKAAACWFGNEWIVTSSALGESVERKLIWNTKNIIETNQTSLNPIIRDVAKSEHYTVVTLHELSHPPKGQTKGKIQRSLASIFRKFIENEKIEIYWQDELLEVPSPRILKAPYHPGNDKVPTGEPIEWDTKVSFNTDSGKLIKGRAYILETMSPTESALNLFWHNRLIKGNFEPNYRPEDIFGKPNSFVYRRLCVELDLSDFKPTIDKRDFIFSDSEVSEQEIVEKLIKFLENPEFPLLKQARNFRKNEPEPDLTPKIDPENFRKPAEIVIEHPIPPSQQNPYHEPRPLGGQSDVEEVFDIHVGGSTWKFTLRIASHESDNYLLDIGEIKRTTENSGKEDETEIQHITLTLGYRHPFTRLFLTEDTKQVILNFILAIGFAEISARRAGQEHASFLRMNIDQFLRKIAEKGLGL